MMNKQPPSYRAFIVTIWESRSNDASVWRYRLENPRSGEKRFFTDIEDLFVALHTQFDDVRQENKK